HELHGKAVFLGALRHRERQAERLKIVVTQHKGGDLFRHRGEETVAAWAVELPRSLGRGERDLDIDFNIGGVDAGRIVDSIGVDSPAKESKLDARLLSEAEVGALADYPGLELRGIYPHRVIGAIAGIGVGFGTRLH